MKKYIYIIGIAIIGLMSACSEIAEGDRLIEMVPEVPADPELPGDPELTYLNVLIEDFTGQRCVNCPNATTIIETIVETYGSDRVIPVAIHCGPFGYAGSAKNIGLMTPTGTEYWNHWFDSTQGQPVAKINRGPATSDYYNWGMSVSNLRAQMTDVKVESIAKFTEDGNLINIETKVSSSNSRKAKLQVWITEDDIVALQKLPDNSTNNEYVHNHVFRAAVNGTWGEDVTLTSPMLGGEIKSHSVAVDSSWGKKLSVVAFVYDDSGVLQVTKSAVE